MLDTPWCLTALRPKLWRLDARAIFPLGLWLVHWSWWTFTVAMAGIALCVVLDCLGLPLEVAFYRLRALLVGPLRPANDLQQLRLRAHW